LEDLVTWCEYGVGLADSFISFSGRNSCRGREREGAQLDFGGRGGGNNK